MKSTFIILAVLIGSLAFAMADVPKIAVYVISSELSNSEKKAFESEILARFVQSGKYRMVDRSNASLIALAEEMSTQREGSVDTDQISELGRQAGVQFLCFVDFTQAFGVYNINARLLETETAVVSKMGVVKIKNIQNIGTVADEIFRQIEGESKAKIQTIQTALPVSEKQGYENFSGGQRVGTIFLNLLPGLGSVVIMDDWMGAYTQWGLIAGGFTIGYSVGYAARYGDAFVEGGVGAVLGYYIGASIWNIARSVTYDKPGKPQNTAYGKYGGFNAAVLPSRQGGLNAYLMYGVGF
jgi:hypothetical protein